LYLLQEKLLQKGIGPGPLDGNLTSNAIGLEGLVEFGSGGFEDCVFHRKR